MKYRPQTVGGHCATWDTSDYRPRSSRRLQYSEYTSSEDDQDITSSTEYTNNFYVNPQPSFDTFGPSSLCTVNISPVDESNKRTDGRRRTHASRRQERKQNSRESAYDLTSQYEYSQQLRSKQFCQTYMNSKECPSSCSEWDISEVSSHHLMKREYRRRRGDDFEVFTIYPEPTPLKREKREKRQRRKSIEWDTSSVLSHRSKDKKTCSYEVKKSKYWQELSSIYGKEKTKNDYRSKRNKDYYEPAIPVVEKYDPSVKKTRPKFGLTSTCTKQSQNKENFELQSDIDWAELSSIYPEREPVGKWSKAKHQDVTPHNLSGLSSIHPSEITTVTTHLSDPTSICTSILPDNPNNTLVSSVLLQQGGDPNIRNTDGKTALDLADPSAKVVLTGKSPSDSTSVTSWYQAMSNTLVFTLKQLIHTHVGLNLG